MPSSPSLSIKDSCFDNLPDFHSTPMEIDPASPTLPPPPSPKTLSDSLNDGPLPLPPVDESLDLSIAPPPVVPNLCDYVLPSNLAYLNDPDNADSSNADPSNSSFLNALCLPDSFSAQSELTFIQGRKGGNQACYDGYVYTADKPKANGHHRWQCRDRRLYKPTCTARLITDGNSPGNNVITVPTHCHPASHREVLKAKAISDIKYSTSATTPGSVVKDVLQTVPADVRGELSMNPEKLKKLNRRYRAKIQLAPSNPSTAAEIVIPYEFLVDVFDRTFLQHDITTAEGYRILLFASDISLNAANAASVSITYADGTFSVCPPQFEQVWIIRGHFDHDTPLPILYALLQNKRLPSYLAVVEFLHSRCPRLNPVSVILDFEQNEHKAFLTFYPRARIQGCLWHFTNCHLKKCKKVFPGFMKDTPLRELCSYVFGLPFVPVDDVLQAWSELKNELFKLRPTPQTVQYIRYTEETWIFSTSYTLDMWNVNAAVNYEEPRTNNASEGGNNAMKRHFKCDHPTIWKFIDCLRIFHAEVETKLEQLAQGHTVNAPRRLRWRKREQQIQKDVEEYNPADKREFMRKIGFKYT